MSASANSIEIPTSVTTISVNARIDYIMRFSKQAVFVVADDSDKYSLIGSQFLGALPANHNAAFISISSKLNDIQIRCRLVEQLFGEALFDPEQPLAITILKLSRNKNESMSIVIEHAHLLSLQLLQEFSQLAEIASKANRTTNILLLGHEQINQLFVDNKAEFSNKLAILSANSGQLISLDALSHNKEKGFIGKYWKTSALILLSVVVVMLVAFEFLYKRNTLALSGLASNLEQNNTSLLIKENFFVGAKRSARVITAETDTDQTMVINSAPASSTEVANILSINESSKGLNQLSIAKPTEIVNELLGESMIKTVSTSTVELLAPAPKLETIVEKNLQTAVINSKLISPNTHNTLLNKAPLDEVEKTLAIEEKNIANNAYFLQANKGYVVQIISFAHQDLYQKFISDYTDSFEFETYYRLLNGRKSIVITSKIYAIKADAISAIKLLPELLQQNGPWIKSVAEVKNEINIFQRSQ